MNQKNRSALLAVPLLLAALTIPAEADQPIAALADVQKVVLQRNTALSDDLLTTQDPFVQSQLATAWQASQLGTRLEMGPVHNPRAPSETVHNLVDRHGLALTVEDGERISELDSLPLPQAHALASVVDAFIAFEDAAYLAYEGGHSDGDSLTSSSTAEASEVGRVLVARDQLLDAAQMFISAFTASAAASGPTVDACPAIAIDLQSIDTTYSRECALTLDLGGNDLYLNNAGGAGIGNCPFSDSGDPPRTNSAAAAIDLAGDDRYTPPHNKCGANGGAWGGAGLLLDAWGDDEYSGGSFGINGGAASGVLPVPSPTGGSLSVPSLGFLMDLAGNDSFAAGGGGANGGGSGYGAGLLIDVAGDDAYTAGGGSANGGGIGNAGIGFLYDASGNDLYTAGGWGTNGGGRIDGGVGFLMDALGDDTYWGGDHGANGGGYDGGVGYLYDAHGHDRYFAGDAGANGGGHQSGSGLLYDGAGNDVYTAGSAGTNGGGGWLGSGHLHDVAGDDIYSAGDWGTNGGGAAEGVGSLFDAGGNDTYNAGSFGTNGGGSSGPSWTASVAGIGSLVDMGGFDTYQDEEGGTGTDKTVVPKGSLGAQIDHGP